MDAAAVSRMLDALDRELWLVTAQAGGRRSGLIATFVSPASIVPSLPRLLVGLAKQHLTWELVEASGALGLHLLGERQLGLVWRFGLASGRDADKFAGLDAHTAVTGSPLLNDVIGWLDCRVETSLDTGDRSVFLAEVVEGRVEQSGPPLTVKQMVQRSPPDKLAELKLQRHLDGLADAEAIRAWRRE